MAFLCLVISRMVSQRRLSESFARSKDSFSDWLVASRSSTSHRHSTELTSPLRCSIDRCSTWQRAQRMFVGTMLPSLRASFSSRCVACR